MIPFALKVVWDPFKISQIRTYPVTYLIGYEVGDYYCPLKSLLEYTPHDFEVTRTPSHMIYELNEWFIGGDPEKEPPRNIAKMKVPRIKEMNREVAMRRDLGISLIGYALPTPNIRSVSNAAEGALKRIMGQVGIPGHPCREFRSFVRLLVRKNFEPLEPGLDMSAEAWLDMCNNYNQERKDELMKVAQTFGYPEVFGPKDRSVETHVKNEEYPSYKYPRLISAAIDRTKISLGAASKYMESVVYGNNGEITIKFIKHVPMTGRIKYIQELMNYGCVKWFSTDYSSFECSFSHVFMSVCEMQLYKHLLKYYPDVYQRFELMMGFNYCRTKNGVSMKIRARRMSGEMVTSLGNGFSNLALMAFIFNEHHLGLLGAVVEGDDGLGTVSCPIDFDSVASKYGFKVKQLFATSIGLAGFCGMNYDEEDKCFVVDPFERILSIGWTGSSKFMHAHPDKLRQALRAKALSLAYECPGCPILTELADYILRVTKDVKPHFEWEYWQEQIFMGVEDRTKLSSDVLETRLRRTGRTRALFADLYGVSETQQLECENYLNHLSGFQHLDGPIRQLFVTCMRPEVRDWSHYYDSYIRSYRPGQDWRSGPA